MPHTGGRPRVSNPLRREEVDQIRAKHTRGACSKPGFRPEEERSSDSEIRADVRPLPTLRKDNPQVLVRDRKVRRFCHPVGGALMVASGGLDPGGRGRVEGPPGAGAEVGFVPGVRMEGPLTLSLRPGLHR